MSQSPSFPSHVAQDTLTERLAHELASRGYVLCDNVGRALGEDRRAVNAVGMLYADRHLKQPRKLGILPRPRRRLRFGTIFTNNITLGASPDYWLFQVVGSEHYDEACKLAKELQQIFGVRISVRRVNTETEGEMLSSDR